MTAALYTGEVTHQRYRPAHHKLRYGMFWVLLDLDGAAVPARLFSRNRPNLFSFHDRDHLAGSAEPLRQQIDRALISAGIDSSGGTIQVLCMPRVCGFVFNPISVYFCHLRDGGLAAMLYEVNNTFGQRHSYLIPVPGPDAATVRHRCDKQFHVSPFLPMAMTYEFRVTRPGEKLSLAVRGGDSDGPLIGAVFAGRRTDLTDFAILRLLPRFGVLTLKVVAAIYWEGLKLWLKGFRLYPVPPPPAHPVTIVPSKKG